MCKKIQKRDDQDNRCSGGDSVQQGSSNQTSPNKITQSPIINHSPVGSGVQKSACESHLDSQTLVCESYILFSSQVQAEQEQSNNSHKKNQTKPRNNNSNNSFKKACTPMKKLVKKYLKVKINPFQNFYYKKSYFMLSLLLLDNQFCLYSEKFSQLLEEYITLIKKLELKQNGQTSLSKEYLEYFQIGIKTFRLYKQGRILQSIKTFYKFDIMKQKGNLKEAIKQYEQERKKLQMEDLELMKEYQNEILSSQNQFNTSFQLELVETPNYQSFSSESNLFGINKEGNDKLFSFQENSIWLGVNFENQSEIDSRDFLNFVEQKEI